MKPVHYIFVGVIAIVLLAISFWIGRITCPDLPNMVMKRDTVTRTRIDTVLKVNPIEVERRIAVHDTVIIFSEKHDTIRLPREQAIYADSTYRAVVSGVQPRLDSIEVYQKTRTITVTVEQQLPPKKWGVGIMAGFGAYYGIASGRFDCGPGVSVGVYYRF